MAIEIKEYVGFKPKQDAKNTKAPGKQQPQKEVKKDNKKK